MGDVRALGSCRGTLLAILSSALWLSHPGGVGAQTSANAGSIKGQVVVVDATGSSYLPGAQLLCGSSGNRPPIDVVSSVQVVSNPFGSQYADSPGLFRRWRRRAAPAEGCLPVFSG